MLGPSLYLWWEPAWLVSLKRESMEREPGRKVSRVFFADELSCSLMLISLSLSF